MIYQIDHSNIDDFSGYMYDYFKLRHVVFVEKMGWESLRSPLGLEVDQFDTRMTQYFMAVTKGQVIGSVRLIPTTLPNIFSDLYGEHLDIDVPMSPKIYELSRFFSYGGEQPCMGDGTPTLPAMMLAALDHAIENGIEAYVAILEDKMADGFLSMSLGMSAAGRKFEYAPGRRAIPIWCPTTKEVRDAVAAAFKTDGGHRTNDKPEPQKAILPSLEALFSIGKYCENKGSSAVVFARRALDDLERGEGSPDALKHLMYESISQSENCKPKANLRLHKEQ